MHEPLKNCPFCGTQPDECDIGQFVVECPSCAIVGPASDNSNAARRAWNTRWGTPAGAGEPVAKLWLWKNFVGGKPEYWAFDNPFPCVSAGGDPLTLGEPCGWALLKPSVNGRPQRSEQEVTNTVYRLHATPQPTQAQAGAVPLTDEQCDAIYEALDAFGREVDHYEYGLPYCTSDGETLAKPEAREVIRQAAHGIKGADHD